MRITPALLILTSLFACKGEPSEPTDVEENCDAEVAVDVSSVQSPDWPAGLSDAIDEYRALDGRYTAEACGTDITVSIRTEQIIDSAIQIVTTPLPAGNTCGCTHDPDYPNDGDMQIIARTTMDLSVQNYPEAGFREENAGNVSSMPVAIFGGSSGLTLRGCALELVPPVLLLDYRDTEVTFRSNNGEISADINLIGPDISDAGCALTNWVRVGDN